MFEPKPKIMQLPEKLPKNFSEPSKTGVMTPEHKEYLDNLRDSGVTNMFGAAPFVQREFGIPIREARAIVSEWMGSFGK